LAFKLIADYIILAVTYVRKEDRENAKLKTN
jgi:hypothetical protein